MATRTQEPVDDWLNPPEEREGLQRLAETIRERLWLIIATVALTVGFALLYLLIVDKTYEAQADLLVSPVGTTDQPALASLPLILQSADPTRDVETGAELVVNLDVARAVARQLGDDVDPRELLEQVEAVPVAQSNIVAVTAKAESPEFARQLANAFAEKAVDVHTADVRAVIDEQLAILSPELEDSPETEVGDASIADIVGQLRLVRAGNVPDLRLQTAAPLPTEASPRPTLVIGSALLAGLILGIAAAFAVQVLDPRLRREAQLRRLYSLPILGRIPKEARSDDQPLAPRELSAVTAEAYRTLRATLSSRKLVGTAEGRDETLGRVILITGSSPSEGKTTTAVSLAASLARASKRVILMESDLRRPALGGTLEAEPDKGGVVSVLIGKTDLADALVQAPAYGPFLKLLLAEYEGGWITELFSIPSAAKMLEEARTMADYVIIDSPPLNEVVDALPLAQQADDVVIVARIGRTRIDKLRQLGELLAENGIRPTGFAVVGTPRPHRGEYHYYGGNNSDSENGQTQRRVMASRDSEA